MKPFLRWAGSKRQHLNGLLECLPPWSGKYVEPFAGSACLFWKLEPARAVLGDLNADLISCYERVAAAPEAVHAVYSKCTNDADEYYRIRSDLHAESDLDVRAGYFIYLNRYCFNGLYRTDRSGHFNVPYGGARTGSPPTIEELRAYSRRLQTVSFKCSDFEAMVDDCVEAGDLVYLDPPYFSAGTRVFNAYTASPFTRTDLDRFDALLSRIDSVGATFVATYLDGDDIRSISAKWRSHDVSVLRRMAGFTASRRRTSELVFTNARIAA
ncbi:MAG: Dam family site-specific DNA-(adenine-N6)-methyltransferase [Sphingorhabdus sp.]